MTWATSLPILVFLGLSVLDLGPLYATDRRQTDVRRALSLNAPTLGRGHNNAVKTVNGVPGLVEMLVLTVYLTVIMNNNHRHRRHQQQQHD